MDVLFGCMRRIGLRNPWLIAGLLAAVLPAVWMRGFTVDDALIAVRYAQHLAEGHGWRFNVGGPSTDGVTPLPWPLVLAPLAGGTVLMTLARAKALGLAASALTGAFLGDELGRIAASAWVRGLVLASLALSVPVAAYAMSGMETSLAALLALVAVLRADRPLLSATLAGLTATLRPEMAPWAFALALGVGIVAKRSPPRVVLGGLVALAPFVVCALVRVVVWGRPAPLAIMAKPSDLSHGLAYAGAACVVTVVPVLVLAPLALRRAPLALVVVVAGVAHFGAIIAVGGDWMPYARLAVPIVPTLAWAGAQVAAHAHPLATGVRTAAAMALGVAFVVQGGTNGRHVGTDRERLVEAATPVLAKARRVAALDIGWVGAATSADVVDLAGLTDPEIAALPGGHTSKRVDSMFLLSRDPDHLLLYAPSGLPGGSLAAWRDAVYTRVVEARLVDDDVIARHFAPVAWLRLGSQGAGYVVLEAMPR
jgi:hypothetical protein